MAAHRPQNWNELTGGAELTEMAAYLHGIASGGTDGWIDGKSTDYYCALKAADEFWHVGAAQFEAYDNAVRAMVKAAISEWTEFLKRHGALRGGK